MFKQVKSALFWYYLFKFRRRVILIVLLLIIAFFANAIYGDVVEYLKLKDEVFEKALESYSESYKQDISYYTNSAEIKLEPVVLGHSSPPEDSEFTEKAEDNLPW